MRAEDLRKSLLQQAIQGKLVKQNPADEPASVLLEHIHAEKQRLINEGNIKKGKVESIIFKGDDGCYYERIGSVINNIDDEINFDLPKGWEYIRLSQIAYLASGFTPSPDELSKNGKFPYFKVSDMNTLGNEKYISITQQYYVGEKTKKCFPKHTIIFPKNGGAVFTNKKRILAQDSIVDLNTGAFIPYGLINVEYAYILFSTIDFREHYKGTALPTVNTEFMDKLIFGLPPLAEQERIVKRIEELMPLVDEYARLEAKDKALDDNLPTLLKQSILQHAIKGKLVEQDENDEPASVLLERIRVEKKAQLGKKYVESYIYKDGDCYYEKVGSTVKNISDEIPFDLPKGWAFERLENIINISSGCNITSAEMAKTEQIYPVYGGNGITGFYDKFNVPQNTIVIGRVGFYCGSVHTTKTQSWVTDNALIVSYNTNYILLPYMELILRFANFGKKSASTAQPLVTGKIIKPHIVAIPPIAEQKRIVEKLNEIFAKL